MSDTAIDNGILLAEAARAIFAEIEAGKREIILATGVERNIMDLGLHAPETLFDRVSAAVRAGYAQKMATDKGEG